jgi:hypothetical protein
VSAPLRAFAKAKAKGARAPSQFDPSPIIDFYTKQPPSLLSKTFNMDISDLQLEPRIYAQLKRWKVETVQQLRWLHPTDLFQMSFTFDQIEHIRYKVVSFVHANEISYEKEVAAGQYDDVLSTVYEMGVKSDHQDQEGRFDENWHSSFEKDAQNEFQSDQSEES